jgi:DNA mismatch repair protein MutS
MGARELRQWVLQPLLDINLIRARLDAVEELVTNSGAAGEARECLRRVYDLERLTARVTARTANPRDLRALGESLTRLPALTAALASCHADFLVQLRSRIQELPDLADLLARALADNPPAQLTDGGIIRDGYNPELDQLREAAAHGREWIAALEYRERQRTNIKSLRVGYNQVFGYYIEVTKPNLHLVPDDYQRKQTLANAERFVTPELKEMEARVLGAEERSRQLEHDLFLSLREEVAAHGEELLTTARAIAQTDAILALAQAAVEYGYCKPEVYDDDVTEIRDGRHPVVERLQTQEPFVPNDCYLDGSGHRMLIITGPNMAGKSTYLRQVALITLMAQMGSFVPAKFARIGLVDRIFTRVGASDDLATGRSTFMIEMTEAANILHNATDRSLIILDEIGRGTSTYDGLSIAWAVAEYIAREIRARTLFATHYHHLNELAQVQEGVRNFRIAVKEEGDRVVFLRKIVPGGTDRSYGIQVARLAGLPDEVISRAKEVLRQIEQEDLATPVGPRQEASTRVGPPVQLQLFEIAPNPIVQEILRLDLDTMSPIEALMKLKEMKDRLQEESGT